MPLLWGTIIVVFVAILHLCILCYIFSHELLLNFMLLICQEISYFSHIKPWRNGTDRFPLLNSLIQRINIRKRRDTLIIGGVVAVCIILLLLYAFRWAVQRLFRTSPTECGGSLHSGRTVRFTSLWSLVNYLVCQKYHLPIYYSLWPLASRICFPLMWKLFSDLDPKQYQCWHVVLLNSGRPYRHMLSW